MWSNYSILSYLYICICNDLNKEIQGMLIRFGLVSLFNLLRDVSVLCIDSFLLDNIIHLYIDDKDTASKNN